MIFREIPQAAGITGLLTAAGLPPAAVHDWFHRSRDELGGLTPALTLMVVGGPAPGRRVLALAQADMLELRELPKHGGVEGSD